MLARGLDFMSESAVSWNLDTPHARWMGTFSTIPQYLSYSCSLEETTSLEQTVYITLDIMDKIHTYDHNYINIFVNSSQQATSNTKNPLFSNQI